jgi:hypothetical protein
MDNLSTLTARVRRLESRWRFTAVVALLLAAGLFVVACAAARRESSDILRVRGIVVTDAAGKARVVIGAPMAGVTEDARLADTVGLVVLDPQGLRSRPPTGPRSSVLTG